MAEPEPDGRTPEANPPQTASWSSVPPFDVAAVEGTAAYPLNSTASVGETPDAELGTVTAPPRADPDLATPPSPDHPQIPGYRILRAVGGGGMGTVFKALHIALNKIVALKLINTGWAGSADFRQRFDREAKTLAALEHPNIVPVYDAGSWQGLPYLTMKFIAGKTLYHHLETIGRDPATCARVLVLVARAVHFLHTKGIIHRDLKPLNILMTEDGTPLVADFGLVRPVDDDSDLSMTRVPLGTRQYMSPEQTLGGRANYTFACDIWALGIILYELLAGSRPFAHDDPAEVIRQIRNDPAPPIPSERNAPAGLEAIARKCLAKAPADRYASAEEVAASLERWLAGDPLPEPPPALPPKSKKTSRGVRVVLGVVLAAVFAVLVAGAAGAFRNPQPDSDSPAQPPPEGTPPAPVAPRPVAERLRTGETVVLVDKSGLPIVPYPSLPNFTGLPTTQREGFLTLNSSDSGAVEFANEPLPWPVRLQGEVALHAIGKHSWAGFFVGRKETPGTKSIHQTALIFAQSAEVTHPPGEWTLNETAGPRFVRWMKTPFLSDTGYDSVSRISPILEKELSLTRWRTFTIDIAPDRIAATWEGRPIAPVTGDVVRKLLAEIDAPGEPFAPPAFGNSLGICVYKAEAAYRNVKLVPLRQSP